MQLTNRDTAIVQTVADCGALTREQLQRHHAFGSTVRTNATLLRLVRHAYLARRFQPTLAGTRRAIYVLGPRGLELLDRATPTRSRMKAASDLFLQHRLMVNDVRFAFIDCHDPEYRHLSWSSEDELRRRGLPVVADGYIEYEYAAGWFGVFVEVDRGTEGPGRWRDKTRAYTQFAFSGLYSQIFKRQFFRVVVVTPTDDRSRALAREVGALTDRIFWFASIRDLLHVGPFAPIWLRPTGEDKHSLTER